MTAELLYYLGVSAVGVVAGVLAGRLPASGKVALALCVLPPAGVGLGMAFC